MIKHFLIALIFLTIPQAYAFEDFIISTDGKLTDIKIEESINIIMSSDIDYEFRTTVLPVQIQIEDFDSIGKFIQGAKRYYLQKFVVQSEILDCSLKEEKNYTDIELKYIKEKLQNYIQFVEIR